MKKEHTRNHTIILYLRNTSSDGKCKIGKAKEDLLRRFDGLDYKSDFLGF